MSWDVFLGAPFNIASTALFLAIMARLSGYTPGTVNIQATNAHLYDNQFEVAQEYEMRPLHDLPQLVLSDNIKQITSLADIVGVFTRIQPDDIKLENYVSEDTLKVEMVA